jgi:hypothetical protein
MAIRVENFFIGGDYKDAKIRIFREKRRKGEEEMGRRGEDI